MPTGMLAIDGSAASATSIGSGDCVSTITGSLTTRTGTSTTFLTGRTVCVVAFTGGTGTWTVPDGITSMGVQMVGGGGGGGNFGGGGGGEAILKGGDDYQPARVTSGASLNVTVGTGGTGGTAASPATSGTDSVFGSFTAKGGGGGGSTDSSTGIGAAGLSGGSGGGGAPDTSGGTGGVGGATTKADGKGEAGGSAKGLVVGVNTYLAGGAGGGAAMAAYRLNGRVVATGDPNAANLDGGEPGQGIVASSRLGFGLAVPLLIAEDWRQFGAGGAGGCSAFATPALWGKSCSGGEDWFGIVAAPSSGAANGANAGSNSGSGGAGGGSYAQAGGAGSDGVVMIAWAPGGGGGAGAPTVTPPGPVPANGTTPVVFDLPPTITPGDSPIDGGATCIVDPATNACGTQVTSPTQGSWSLDLAAGTLTFTPLPTATPGATESVVLRVTGQDGKTGEGTFSVLIPDGSTRPGFTG